MLLMYGRKGLIHMDIEVVGIIDSRDMQINNLNIEVKKEVFVEETKVAKYGKLFLKRREVSCICNNRHVFI